ncbi:hypothetical protein MPER_05515, partial [Moniliophthora perniciosa FA553]
VDKLFNPFTLLAGPCLVGYLIFKSTKSVQDGGYHLPWWNIILSYIVWLSLTPFTLFGYYFAVMKLHALYWLGHQGRDR